MLESWVFKYSNGQMIYFLLRPLPSVGTLAFKVLIVEGWIFYWGVVESSGVGSEVEKNFVGG